MPSKPWQLSEALEFVRYLQGWVEPYGYYVGMTGSVLLKGESRKDLDVILYPASSQHQQYKPYLHEVFQKAGLKQEFNRAFFTKMWREAGSDDEKHVEVWRCTAGLPLFAGKRVDLFFLV